MKGRRSGREIGRARTHLEDRVQLGGEHHVALCLELAGHERLLAIQLPEKKGGKRKTR